MFRHVETYHLLGPPVRTTCWFPNPARRTRRLEHITFGVLEMLQPQSLETQDLLGCHLHDELKLRLQRASLALSAGRMSLLIALGSLPSWIRSQPQCTIEVTVSTTTFTEFNGIQVTQFVWSWPMHQVCKPYRSQLSTSPFSLVHWWVTCGAPSLVNR